MTQKYLISKTLGQSNMVIKQTRDEFLMDAGMVAVVPDKYTQMASGHAEGTIGFDIITTTGYAMVIAPDGNTTFCGYGEPSKPCQFRWTIPKTSQYLGGSVKRFLVYATLFDGVRWGDVVSFVENSQSELFLPSNPIRVVMGNLPYENCIQMSNTFASVRSTTGYVKCVIRDGQTDSRSVLLGTGVPNTDIAINTSTLGTVRTEISTTPRIYYPPSTVDSNDNNITIYPCDMNGTITGELTKWAYEYYDPTIYKIVGTTTTTMYNNKCRLYADNCRLLSTFGGCKYYTIPNISDNYHRWTLSYNNLPSLTGSHTGSYMANFPSWMLDYSNYDKLKYLALTNYHSCLAGLPYGMPKLPTNKENLYRLMIYTSTETSNADESTAYSETFQLPSKRWYFPDNLVIDGYYALERVTLANITTPKLIISNYKPIGTDVLLMLDVTCSEIDSVEISATLYHCLVFRKNNFLKTIDISGAWLRSSGGYEILDVPQTYASKGCATIKRIIIATTNKSGIRTYNAKLSTMGATTKLGIMRSYYYPDTTNELPILDQIWIQGFGTDWYQGGLGGLPNRVGKTPGTIYCYGSPTFYNMASVITECTAKNWVFNTENLTPEQVPLTA